ncbi:MAG: sigma 54-interacting transcriptional regulator [Chitinophagaceae bacterium]|nr:sigma 54-interacting transcriptional regulator [Chitinophagaceae bacterium]
MKDTTVLKEYHRVITTLGQLKEAGYIPKTIKEEIRTNLINKLSRGEVTFPGIIGYEDTVIPDVERALLSKHNILFLGLRGQAKTRMARLMVELLDEYIPVIRGSELNDDPFHPISRYGKEMKASLGDEMPIEWIHRSERYGEKLATPDVSIADLIGDIDPIKAANLKLSFSDEKVIHFGIIPRCNRGIFVINELPDLQPRIQVALFNLLEEGDIQIRGFKLRIPLDILFVFTANPEDYTNRGSIVTPLKDRIESQILTHYPKSIEHAMAITEQEAKISPEQSEKIDMSDLVKRIIEQIALEARQSEWVDKKSGVSARLTISAYENAYSAAERRGIMNREKNTQVWISDLIGIIPSVTGKIELVYEGEQEGPFQVALHLLEKAIRTQFASFFPAPDRFKKKSRNKSSEPSAQSEENPYLPIQQWFDAGNRLDLLLQMKDSEKMKLLKQVNGLEKLVKQSYPHTNEMQAALLMEFVLHGLATFSLISKKFIEGAVQFRDLLGGIVNLGDTSEEQYDG